MSVAFGGLRTKGCSWGQSPPSSGGSARGVVEDLEDLRNASRPPSRGARWLGVGVDGYPFTVRLFYPLYLAGLSRRLFPSSSTLNSPTTLRARGYPRGTSTVEEELIRQTQAQAAGPALRWMEVNVLDATEGLAG